MISPWFNYKTGDVDFLEGPPEHDHAHEYLPPHPVMQNLYQVLRADGWTVLGAMSWVLQRAMPQ